jgi:hypothetical protein
MENFNLDKKLSCFDEIKSSCLHNDISNCLQSLNIKFKNEFEINELFCDIFLENSRIIIEVNGPSHYAYKSDQLLGHTIFKNRLLKAMNQKVITIPYWEWDDLNNIEEKKLYILNLLK